MRSLLRVLPLLVVLACPSCFTIALWEGNTDALMGDGDDYLELDRKGARLQMGHWATLFYKVPLTPITAVLDLVTTPLQAVYYYTGDSERYYRRTKPMGTDNASRRH